MATAHLVKGKEGLPNRWICNCGSGFPARFNILNKYNCPNEERVCVSCFKKPSARAT